MIFKKYLQPVFYGLLIFIAVLACRPNVDRANWDVQALTPILSTRIDIDDLQQDTTIQAGSDGLLSLVLRQRLADVKPDEVAPPFNQVFALNASIKSIELPSRTIQRQLTLGQIASQAGAVGQFIIGSHGSNQAIPALSGLGPSVFAVDATEFFESMTLRDGWMILRLENNLPVDLTNLQYEITNQGGGPALLQNTVNALAVGAVYYDSVRLQNNVVITGELQATLLNADSPGSNGQQVLIDTSDAIDLQLTINKLDPVAATAIFPAQNLIEDTSTAQIGAATARLTAVYVEQGKVFIDAISTVEDQLTLQYLFPGAVRNNKSLEIVRQISAAAPGGSVSERFEVEIEDYRIDLTSLPGKNVFNEFYSIFLGRVDSSGKLISLSLTDSVYVQTGIENLVAKRGYGFIGYDTASRVQTTPISQFQKVISGKLQLSDANISLELENFIGAPMELKINQVIAQSGGQSLALSWDKVGTVENLGRASENTPGEKPQPSRQSFILDAQNSNILQLIELLPKQFTVNVEAYMNRGQPNTDLSQFLYVDYGIEAYLNAEIPLNLGLDDLTMGDTSAFNYADLDPDGRLQSGSFKLIGNNFYPFQASVDMVLLDENRQPLEVLNANSYLQAAETDGDGRALNPVESTIELPFSAAQVASLKNARHILFKVKFNTAASTPKVKIYSDNYIDLQLVGDLNLSTK